MISKRCKGPCGCTKPAVDFHKCNSRPDGLQSYCIDCSDKHRRIWTTKVIAVEPPTGWKHCRKCGTKRRIAEFHVKSSSTDGLQSICKNCMALHNRGYYGRRRKYLMAGVTPPRIEMRSG